MKLGPHGDGTSTPQALAWARQAPIVKQINGTDLLRAAKPDAIRVLRKYFSDSDQTARIQGMAVQDTFNQIMALNPQPGWYVEVFNETNQRQRLGLEGYADFTAGIVPLFHAKGIRVAGFSFSTGNPGSAQFGDRDDFQYLYNRGWCGVDVIALHEYWGPDGFQPAYALRHRALVAGVPTEPGIIITETGRDAVDGGARGWKLSGITAEQYQSELAAYANLLKADSYVLGATVFTASPTPDWVNYSTDELNTQEFYVADDTQAQLDTLKKQVADYVELSRSILKGDWDTARIQLDGIDPNDAGKWTNVQFPKP